MARFAMLLGVALGFVASVVGGLPDDASFGSYSKNVASIKQAAKTYQPPPPPAVDAALVNHPVEAGSDVLARWRLNHGPLDSSTSAVTEEVKHPEAPAPSSSSGKISVAKDEADVRSSLKDWRVQEIHAEMQSMHATSVVTAAPLPEKAGLSEVAPSEADVESGSEALDQWSERKKFEAKAAAGAKKAAEDKKKADAEAERAAPPSSLFPTAEAITPRKHKVDIAKDLADMKSAVHSSKSDEIHNFLSGMRNFSGNAAQSTPEASSEPALLTGSAMVNRKLDHQEVAHGNDVLEQWRLSHMIHKDDSKENADASAGSAAGQHKTSSKSKHHKTPAEDAEEMKETMDEWKHASNRAELHAAMHSMGANVESDETESPPGLSKPSSEETMEGASALSDWRNSHRTLADDAVDLHTTLEETKSEVPVIKESTPKKHPMKPLKQLPTVPPELLKAQSEDDVQGMNDAFKAFHIARQHENMQNIADGADELAKKVSSKTTERPSKEQVVNGEKGEDALKQWQLHKKIENMMPGISANAGETSTSPENHVEEASTPSEETDTHSTHHAAHEDVVDAFDSKPKKRTLSSDAAAMHASMKEWATQQIHEKLQNMKVTSSQQAAALPVPPDARGPQVAEQRVFLNATEKADGAEELKEWTEQHKMEMQAKQAAAASASGEATVVQVGEHNGLADSSSDAELPERKEAADVRNAMEAWTSKNMHKVQEQPSSMKFLKSKLNEIAHSDMPEQGPQALIAHKRHSISDDVANMHNAAKEWSISSIHQFMAGNLSDLTAAAKHAAEKASRRGELSAKPGMSESDSIPSAEEGASILDSYMQGHDPSEFREMEKAQRNSAVLAEKRPESNVPRVHRVPPGHFRWRGF